MLKVNRRSLAVVAALSVCVMSGGHLAAQVAVDDQSPRQLFVELSGPVEQFRNQARAAGLTLSERYVYRRIWKGLSVETTAEGAARLATLSSVRAVFPVLTVDLAPVEEVSPDLLHALAMTGADVAQETLELTGAGVKVAVMDTGIDYHHPDLGGGFGPGARVVAGFDFVGDRFDAGGSGGALRPHPDGDPDDCNGHGTHVAGIIGASGTPPAGARGVAPGVTFGAYRVFGCDGSTSTDIMLAAMERALDDDMDVLNMSIGAAFQTWPQYPTAVGADALVDAGMIVVTSIGNSGANGVYSASAPGVGRKVIGVASLDNSHLEMPTFDVLIAPDPEPRPFGYIQATAAPDAPTTGTRPLARTGTPASAADACLVAQPDGTLASPLPAGSLAGKVALIRRGTCSFYEKSRNAEVAGAVGVVLYNNVAGFISPTVAAPAGSPPITIPVVAVLASDGALLSGQLAAPLTSTIDLTWTNTRRTFPNPTAGTASAFTSYGLNAELQLKPNIAAPGGLIRSTYPLELGGYATISGTSMASPHVAGAVALFLEKHPGARASAVQTALQNTADPAILFGNAPLLDAANRQGAGMLDIDDAIQATTRLTPSELSLGEGTAVHTKEITITNASASPLTYALEHQPAVGTGANTFSAAPQVLNNAAVAFSTTSVTVAPGESATVSVAIQPRTTAAANRTVYGGYIAVSGGGQTYRVPYAGFTGDYQSIVVLAPGGCSFPGIFKRGGETVCLAGPPAQVLPNFTRQPEAMTFNVDDRNDRPVILYHRAHQSRRLEIRALDVATNQSHLVAFADYLSRNATNGRSLVDGGFNTFTWDGKRLFTNAAGQVHREELPSGLYKLQLVVTKALAEDGNAAHVETWTSPTINITR